MLSREVLAPSVMAYIGTRLIKNIPVLQTEQTSLRAELRGTASMMVVLVRPSRLLAI
jgi:hypothetical protein